jgi:FtsZ-interacting cell division protein ZipA
MLRTFAIVLAGAGIFASLPLTSAWACDDDRYPCPIRSEALIQETVPAPDQLVPDEPQKKVAQPQKKAKQTASTNEKAHAKRDPRAPAGAKVSKPAASREQAPDAVSQKPPQAAPAVVASPRADEQARDDESRGGSLLTTAGAAWPVSPVTDGAADTPAATSIASNAVQMVDPNEVNELDREASVESSWVNYLLWMLGAALAAAFALWLFSRMGFLFGRRTANAG